jgi:hypothetical protein
MTLCGRLPLFALPLGTTGFAEAADELHAAVGAKLVLLVLEQPELLDVAAGDRDGLVGDYEGWGRPLPRLPGSEPLGLGGRPTRQIIT